MNNHAGARHTVRSSLRLKVAVGVALPLLVILIALSEVIYLRGKAVMEEQVAAGVEDLGEITLGGLQHAMQTNQPDQLLSIMTDLREMQNVQRVEIVGLNGVVAAAGDPADVGKTRSQKDMGCAVCHDVPAANRPITARLEESPGVLRISAPIVNSPDCATCHGSQPQHLGMLLIDFSVGDVESRLLGDLRLDLGASVLATLLVSLAVFFLTHRLVVRRVESMEAPLEKFSEGDFSVRLQEDGPPSDELDQLAHTFNLMAQDLDRLTKEAEERSSVRQRAIAEERERIARELHDGLAQLLAYVNTKVLAVQLLLRNGHTSEAQTNLDQLGEAARALFTDTREAIVGLRTASQSGAGLASAIRSYVDQFRRLSDLPVVLQIDSSAEAVALPADSELQLVRILQEALSNARKHACATHADVKLQLTEGTVLMSVADDGVGFDPVRARVDNGQHFGLSTMRERARGIGADLTLHSKPGEGTEVKVKVHLSRN